MPAEIKAYTIALLFQAEGKTLLVAGTGIGPSPEAVVGALVARTVQEGVSLPFIGSTVHELNQEFLDEVARIPLQAMGDVAALA